MERDRERKNGIHKKYSVGVAYLHLSPKFTLTVHILMMSWSNELNAHLHFKVTFITHRQMCRMMQIAVAIEAAAAATSIIRPKMLSIWRRISFCLHNNQSDNNQLDTDIPIRHNQLEYVSSHKECCGVV